MRTRSASTQSVNAPLNFSPVHSDRPAGGRRMKLPLKFPKFFGGNRSSPTKNVSTTDVQQSCIEAEPVKVIRTFEQNLGDGFLSEACQLLIEREDRLFMAITEATGLQQWQEDVNKLSEDHKALEVPILQALRLSLRPQEISREALTSAVKAVCLEDEQDQLWTQRIQTPPQWRPSQMRKQHNSTLQTLVEERLDNPVTPPAEQVHQSSIQADVCSMGRQLKQDLLTVVQVVKSCYPPDMDICNFFAKLYHQAFSVRLRKMIDIVLDNNDCTFLLRWVNEYYPEIFQKPEIAASIDAEVLGKLLPEDVLKCLEEQYLSKHQSELTTYIHRVLQGAKEMWLKEEEPTTEDGCFTSPVAIDIIQFINGAVTSAEKVLADRHKAQRITNQLTALLHSYNSFQDEVSKRNKSNSGPIIKANLECIEQFRNSLITQRHLFPDDVQESCLSVLSNMKKSAHEYLLNPVHSALKPHYRKLGTSDWLKGLVFQKLHDSIKDHIQHLQGSGNLGHQELMGQFHLDVTAEYVKRLLRGDKLKDKERQEKAYQTVKDNAETMHSLFTQMQSQEHWLRDVLICIAEVLKLQDLAAIQVHIASLGTAFPDLSESHVSALLKLKSNLTKANRRRVKDTLTDALREASRDNIRPFFCRVHLK